MPAEQTNNLSAKGGSASGGKERQPVVVVMGHVDHGKTSLLDYIRKTTVAAREAGGITQAVGAYEIEHKTAEMQVKKITFIDTPGHEAFSKMRSRGADAADLAILVVAAEEGVKPQTKEAIRILTDTKTPFVVAITKIDKPAADVDKVKNDLTANNVFLEGYGGTVSFQPVSSKTGEGINELLDLLVLSADMEELRYDPAAPATGFVLETRTNKNRGMEATVIVRNGILRRGEDIATPTARGKVKILENFQGEAVPEIPAGAPALIVGLESLPQVGETFQTGKAAQDMILKSGAASAPEEKSKEGALNLILKSNDAGSLEVLSQILRAMSAEQPMKILSESVGEVGENDVKLAVSGHALVIAFKSKIDRAATNLAQAQGVEIVFSDIVYELVDAIDKKLKELQAAGPTGEMEVLAVFNSARADKQVVGGRVISGNFRKMPFQIKRGEQIIGQGRVTNLQIQKQDTASVPEGKECGILAGASVIIEKGDHLLIFD